MIIWPNVAEVNMTRLTFRIDDELEEALDQIDETKSESVRNALEEYLDPNSENPTSQNYEGVNSQQVQSRNINVSIKINYICSTCVTNVDISKQ